MDIIIYIYTFLRISMENALTYMFNEFRFYGKILHGDFVSLNKKITNLSQRNSSYDLFRSN